MWPVSNAPRLQLVLARAGIASRRAAETIIVDGRVSVDGVIIRELGTRVDPMRHQIAVDGRPVAPDVVARYIMLNKPVGYVTTADDPDGRPTVMELVPPIPGLFPVGRLDVASEGLIFFTTDGVWAQRASHPRYGCRKDYLVDVTGDASPAAIATMRAPMVLGPTDRTSGARVDVIWATRLRTRLRIVLHEGRNRQIRRMCEIVGLEVIDLVRVMVGGVGLGTLVPGEWRDLTREEIALIARQVAMPLPTPVSRGLQRRAASANRIMATAVSARPSTVRRLASRREAFRVSR
jgi:pseudouridine synthase